MDKYSFLSGVPLTRAMLYHLADTLAAPLDNFDLADIERGRYRSPCRQRYLGELVREWLIDNSIAVDKLYDTDDPLPVRHTKPLCIDDLTPAPRRSLELLAELYAECDDRLRRQGRSTSEALIETAGWRAYAEREGVAASSFSEHLAMLAAGGLVNIEGPHAILPGRASRDAMQAPQSTSPPAINS